MSKKIYNKGRVTVLGTYVTDPSDAYFAFETETDLGIPEEYFNMGQAVHELTVDLGNLNDTMGDTPNDEQVKLLNWAYSKFAQKLGGGDMVKLKKENQVLKMQLGKAKAENDRLKEAS